MALDTYTNLKAAVADWLHRTDLTSQVPDFITMAEAQMSRRLVKDGPVRRMMAKTDLTVNAEYVTLPTDFMGIRSIRLPGSLVPLEFAGDAEKIDELKEQYSTQTGDPQVYSIVGSEVQFWPWTGATTYTGKLIYWQRIPALSVSVATNWMLTLNPDAYLYGSLLQAAPYLKNDERLNSWVAIYTTIIDDIVKADKVERAAPHLALPPRTSGTP